MKSKPRFDQIDILKALGIILVVLGHSGAPGSQFIYMFHMPVFFMASGYVYSEKHSQSVGTLLKNTRSKLSRLWFPYFFWNSLYILLNNVFLELNLYTDNAAIFDYVGSTVRANLTKLGHYMDLKETISRIFQSAFFSSRTAMGGAMWFFGTLFYISVGYPILDWLIRKCLRRDPWLIQTVLSVAFLCMGFHYGPRGILFYGVNRALSSYILFHLGYSLKKFRVLQLLKTKLHHGLLGVCSLTVLVVMHLQYTGYSVDLWSNFYLDPVYLLMAAVAGWGFVYSAAYFLKDTCLKKPLLHVGQRTMSITILHYFCFKVVALAVIGIYDLPIFCLAAHSHLYGEWGLWWVAYTVVGLALPLLAYDFYKKVQKSILPPKIKT